MPLFKAAIVDLDGTLIEFKLDYMSLRAEVIAFLVGKGIPSSLFSTGDSLFKTLDKLEVYLRGKGEVCDKFHELYVATFALADPYELDAVRKASMLPGAKVALKSLRDMELRLGLFTTDGVKAVKYALAKFGLSQFFDVVVTREDVQKVKPHSSHLLTAMSSLNVHPKEVVVVGDSMIDIMCAKNVGALAVGVTTGFAVSDDLQKVGADYIITSISELPSLLLGL
jgi:HAD superfamily hydrolase (TIGR01509 family)